MQVQYLFYWWCAYFYIVGIRFMQAVFVGLVDVWASHRLQEVLIITNNDVSAKISVANEKIFWARGLELLSMVHLLSSSINTS